MIEVARAMMSMPMPMPMPSETRVETPADTLGTFLGRSEDFDARRGCAPALTVREKGMRKRGAHHGPM